MNKVVRTALLTGLILVLLMGCFSGGLLLGYVVPRQASIPSLTQLFPTLGTGAQDTGTPEELKNLFAPFWRAWDIVHEQYVDQPVDDELLMQGAIQGMLESLGDPHTQYLDPNLNAQQSAPLKGEYDGIGAWVDTSGDYVVIISPMPGSPAESAGLRPGDTVIAVDGEDMTGIDGSLVLRRILGPAGSNVTLTISRENEEIFDVTLERAEIEVPSATGEMLEGDIAYVQLLTFAEESRSELRETLRTLLAEDPQGLILDLRNNGGGYLLTAVDVVSEFIDDGVVLYEEFGDGRRVSYEVRSGGLATDIPLVVLVNEGSASASEITAGAIRDHERGLLVGTTTYGKGSVQNWIPLDVDQGAVLVTVARWLTPNGDHINEIGLEPDVVVEITEEDFEQGRDPQLERAIEVLRENR
ncbi:MAG TPA: S41 family peptidase [Anaerolineaceae bacterium]|nr:S41 family peptidase [Anaerolineaceae bacterium]